MWEETWTYLAPSSVEAKETKSLRGLLIFLEKEIDFFSMPTHFAFKLHNDQQL